VSTAPADPPPADRGSLVFLACLFVLALALPPADMFLRFDPSPPLDEKRELAALPAVPRALGALDRFPRDFDAWFQDRFGFRDTLIRAEAYIRVVLFEQDAAGEVLVGDHGWLYVGKPEALKSYRRDAPLTEAEIDGWLAHLEGLRAALAERGVRFLFVVPPNKGTIYPEHLPERFRTATGTKRIDQLYEALRARSAVETLDLRPALVAARRSELIYARTDTHWNDRGAWVAAQAFRERLAEWFPAIAAVPLPGVEFHEEKRPGDLAVMAGVDAFYPEFWPVAVFDAPAPRPVALAPAEAEPLFPWCPPTRELTSGNDALPRALWFHDSFAVALAPMIARDFSTSRWVWAPKVDFASVDAFRPDVVVWEVGERLLEWSLEELPYSGRAR